MRIVGWFSRKLVAREVRRQSASLSDLRAALKRLKARSPQMTPLVAPEMARARELARQLRKVKTRQEMQQWRSLLNMCLPALQALLGTAPAPARRTSRQSRNRKGPRSRRN